jgi:KDO2-lipid IV(A) lauroyltransferase
MRPKDIPDYFVYLVIRLLICFAQAVRIETCAALARGFATLFTRLVPMRAKVIEENLRLAFPELSAAAKQQLTWRMWEHLFLMVAEVAHAPRKIHTTNWRQYICIERMADMMRMCFSGRPTVAVSGHFGNFELANFLIGLFGIEIISVVRPIENRFLDAFVHRFRAAKGRKILQKTGSAGDINAHLARGGFLSVLADQHAGPKGCWVDFFHHPASTHKAIALFSLAHDAPMIVGYVRRLGRPLEFEMGMQDTIDPRQLPASDRGVPEITQWYTHVLERIIRRDPEQYWWVHRRWKDSRPANKRKTAA